MKNLKILLLFGAVLFFTQNSFAQSEECKQKMGSMMQEFQKEMASNPDMTREKADALTENFLASAKKKFPECFPKDVNRQIEEQQKSAELELQKEREKLAQLERQEAKKEAQKEKEANVKEAKEIVIKKPKALTVMENKRNTTDQSNTTYKEFRKDCMRDMQSVIKDLRERSLKYLEDAKNPAAEKEVRAAYQEARSRILHDCAILKMEALKKS